MYKTNKNIVKITITTFDNTIFSMVFEFFLIPKHHKYPERIWFFLIHCTGIPSQKPLLSYVKDQSLLLIYCIPALGKKSWEFTWTSLSFPGQQNTSLKEYFQTSRKSLHMIYLKEWPVSTRVKCKDCFNLFGFWNDLWRHKPLYFMYIFEHTYLCDLYMLYMCSCLNIFFSK